MSFQVPSIPSFYEGRSVFITGATGFVGKVLLEKLLRSCPGLKKAFVLMREKRGKDPRQRLDELLSCKVFDLVKKEHPNAVNKVIGISGDMSLPQLGVSQADLNILSSEVSVVFHSAATVKFDEPIKKAVDMNILGTRRLLQLCHQMKNIEAIIHVSTAYCNCDRTEVDEIIYPTSVKPDQIIDATKWMSDDVLDSITPRILGEKPNTYVFTKALAENLIVEECGSLPIAIVRPSIVSASWKEPYPGWIDNLNGPAGIIVAGGKGVLRTMVIHGEVVADIIPVDVVINLMIAVGWHTSVSRPNSIMVYNCTSSMLNKTTWYDIMESTYPMILKYPSTEIFRYPNGSFKRNHFHNTVSIAFQHYLPAIIVDSLAYLFLQKPGMMRVYQKVHKATQCLQYFTTHEWKFSCENVISLNNTLSVEDKNTFFFDVRSLNWPEFWENHVFGCRKYLLKEDPATIPAARKNLRRRYVLSQVTQVVFAFGVWQFFVSRLLSLNDVWDTFLSTLMKIQELF